MRALAICAGSVIGTNAFYDKSDNDPVSALRRLDSKPLYKSDCTTQVQQPGSPISSLNTSHCSAMDTSDDVQSAGCGIFEVVSLHHSRHLGVHRP